MRRERNLLLFSFSPPAGAPMMAKTDQFFKSLVQQFLPELLQLFLPEEARHLDFSTLRFLGTEVWTNWPVGLRRDVDVLAEMRTYAGTPAIVVVRLEIQAQP